MHIMRCMSLFSFLPSGVNFSGAQDLQHDHKGHVQMLFGNIRGFDKMHPSKPAPTAEHTIPGNWFPNLRISRPSGPIKANIHNWCARQTARTITFNLFTVRREMLGSFRICYEIALFTLIGWYDIFEYFHGLEAMIIIALNNVDILPQMVGSRLQGH